MEENKRLNLLKINKNKNIKENYVLLSLYRKDISCLYKSKDRFFVATMNGYFHEIMKESFIEVFGKDAV